MLYALVAATLALMFQCSYIQKREQQMRGDYELVDVLVAKKTIPKDYKLDETMVGFAKIPKKFVMPKALHKIDEILGQISGSTIFEGEQLISTKLLSIEDAGLAFKIPKGYRAFTVAVSEISGVGGLVRPGNYVDLLGTFDFGDERRTDPRAVTLLQSVYVLAAGEDLGQAVPVNVSGLDESVERRREGMYRSVTVMLSPSESQKILLAQEVGAITLTLRSLWDENAHVGLTSETIHSAIGVPDKVIRTPRPQFIERRAGEY